MSYFSDAYFTIDDSRDYEAMQADTAIWDERQEARFRAEEVNFGLNREDAGFLDEEEPEPVKPRCRCALCAGLPEPLPSGRETRAIARNAEVA